MYKCVIRWQHRLGLSKGATLAAGAVFLLLVAALFIALVDGTLALCPQLLVPREHVD
jgi:hypothetical protein